MAEAIDDPFLNLRERLRRVAYRMLGSVSDAEDVVQDAWLRWQAIDPATLRSAEAFLVTMVSRLAIDRLRQLQVARTRYPGPWLPEPLLDPAPAPEERRDLDESLSMGMLLLLERLSPVERAAFVLSEAFDYSHADIAALLGAETATARQWLHRARQRVAESRGRFTGDPERQRALLARFLGAARGGDLAALQAMLVEDATLHADGGGRATAAIRIVEGTARIARVVAHLSARVEGLDPQVQPVWVNGGWGVVVRAGGEVHSLLTLELRDDRVARVFVVRNPDKLAACR